MVEPAKRDEEERISINLRPLLIWLHYFGYILYIFTTSRFSSSISSGQPYYFYIISILFALSVWQYSIACSCSPGFVTTEPENTEGLFYCQRCQMHIPLRASHCRTCGHCVLRRDHHCPWTGQCIGRDNHLEFYKWLIIETTTIAIALFDIISSLFVRLSFVNWLEQFWCNLILIIPFGFCMFQVSVLTFDHTCYISNNLTVWELARFKQVTYFKDRPMKKFNPFDKGLLGNIEEFINMKKDQKVWHKDSLNIDDFLNEPDLGNDALLPDSIKESYKHMY